MNPGIPNRRRLAGTILLLVLVFVYVFLEFSDARRQGQNWIEYYALMRGVTVLAISVVTETISGCDLNPFSVLAASLVSTNVESYQWVYFIPPVIGASIGGLLYHKDLVEKFFKSAKQTEAAKA